VMVRTYRREPGFAVGDTMTVGHGASRETVTVTDVGTPGPNGSAVDFTPALARAHPAREHVATEGTGLDLAAPLRYDHADNLPFSDRGTGISFTPATAFAHSSDEPVLPLGTGITLDRPLADDHAIDAAVRDGKVKATGYQGAAAPNQWFGGPALGPGAGAMVLRDAAGRVVDSQNYGGLVDPWAAEGYQASSGRGQSGCSTPAPEVGLFGFERRSRAPAAGPDRSAGRFPDGRDTDSNCHDFLMQAVASLSAPSAVGQSNIEVTSVGGFAAGQEVVIDDGENRETAVIATVGAAGGTTLRSATGAGAVVIPVANVDGFSEGEDITIGRGAQSERAVVASVTHGDSATIEVVGPLAFAHSAGAPVSGSGITLATPLMHAHDSGAQIANGTPTPGAPNQYYRRPR
jgi:hypothetical protein